MPYNEILRNLKRNDAPQTDFEISMSLLSPDSQMKRWLAAAIASIVAQMAVVQNYISKLNAELAASREIIEEIKQKPHPQTANFPADVIARYEGLMVKFESLKTQVQQAVDSYFALQLRYIALQQLNLTLDKSKKYHQEQKQQTRKDFWTALKALAPEVEKTPVLEAVVEKQLQEYVDAKKSVDEIEGMVMASSIEHAKNNNVPVQEECLTVKQRDHVQKAHKFTINHELKLRFKLAEILHTIYPAKSPVEIKSMLNGFFKNYFTLGEMVPRKNQFLAHYNEKDAEIILDRIVVEKNTAFFSTAKEELASMQQSLNNTERLVMNLLEDLMDTKKQIIGLSVQLNFSRDLDDISSPISLSGAPRPSPIKSH